MSGDPTMRSFSTGDFANLARLTAMISQLPAPAAHAGVEVHAPVLITPRVLEPRLCRELIAYYEQTGGTPSGVMRLRDGKTTGVMDDSFKRRRDALISDESLLREIRVRLSQRLLPEIERAFMFPVTRVERYIVAAYDAEEGGHFRAHRDNESPGTAHRRFACSINLNAEEFEGGELRFPEYGTRRYRPPTGGAVVFSCSLLHEVTPVTRGRRYAVLPFFYDEAAARIREQNAHLVAKETIVAEPSQG
ncbi:2OG-Fe(II) oxygenase [Phenylobacterium sp. J426]|uniref:2OG-Fe(II) oxygenase family protein n=1 Tax=Phenylobacterium sp. J426 TaxID=2898439 RepID=UPI002151ECB1|nr:2OG-Fe(II) oxygenase [Phenylobacterium sp. J426]MCR5875083.1 2OG-Fe(II) oxygenase [Phenylobacterium sp. J426]